MFRFLHAADAHIDSPMDGLSRTDGAPTTALRAATRAAFTNLVQLAIDRQVHFVLIAGDLYDGDWKDIGTGLFVTRQMKTLADNGIQVYIIAGNHDAASVLTRQLELPANVHVFSTRVAETKHVAGLPVVIHGRGFPDRAVPENLAVDYPPAVRERFNIGLLHTSLSGLEGHDTYAPCTVSDLLQKDYDYWALGHIHQPQVLHEKPWIGYSGNLQGRHVRESGPRGCRLVTVSSEGTVAATEFCPLDVVRWAAVAVDATGLSEFSDLLARVEHEFRQVAAEAGERLLAVRLILNGATALHAQLKSDLPGLRDQCLNHAQLAAGDQIWIEQVRIATIPVQDPEELAERDDLTRIVLESLKAAEDGKLILPGPVRDLLKVLPADLRQEFELELNGPDNQPALIDDVRSLLLNAFATKSGVA